MYKGGTYTIFASNDIFGDPNFGSVKFLTITYGCFEKQIISANENLSISMPNDCFINSANFGGRDITADLKSKYAAG